MKLSKVAAPRGNQTYRGLAGIGLAVFAVLSSAPALAADAAKPAAAAPAPAKPAQASKPAAASAGKPATAKPVPVMPAECQRTGQRVIAALARDDTGAASQFSAFYENFKCAPPHLAQAFGCLVNLQTANPGLANPTPEQVAQCWGDPTTIPKVAPPPPPPPPQQ